MNKRQRTIALNTVSANVETITPEDAVQYLELNLNNRSTKNRAVRSYANDMVNGDWECNGESIIFDCKGKLRNGQNRMKAIVRSGETIVSVVVRGVSLKAFDTMDQGKIRSPGEILSLEKDVHVNPKLLASTLKALYKYNEYRSLGDALDIHFTPRFAKNLRMIYKNVDASVEYSSQFKRPLITATLIATLHYIFSKINSEHSEVFLNGLLTGDCGEHSEILKLRNYFLDIKMNEKTKGMMRNRTLVGGVIIKAWNAWREDRILKSFEYKKGEEFPRAK